jgi:mono/diheme cytochrome c family protein
MNRAWLSTDSAHNAARRGGEPGVRVSARSRAGRCALLVLLGALSGAQSRAQNLEEVVKRGETVFASTCATGYCHGPKGSAGGAPRLAARGFDQNYIAGTLARGIPGTAMASFAASLSRADFTAVVAYLATLNGIANPSLAGSGSAPRAPAPTLTPEAARGRALFSDAVRGFGRCSTCHEVNGIGISVATPISEIPDNPSALRLLSTPQVSTAVANSESMPALVVGNTRRAVIFYDLTTVPPVLRTMDPGAVKIADGASWRHASVIASYSDAELAAILEYLRAAGK